MDELDEIALRVERLIAANRALLAELRHDENSEMDQKDVPQTLADGYKGD